MLSIVKTHPSVNILCIGDAILVRVRSKFANGAIALPESAKRQVDVTDSYIEIAATPELDPNGKPWKFIVGDQVIMTDTAMVPVREMGEGYWMVSSRAIIGVIQPVHPATETESAN